MLFLNHSGSSVGNQHSDLNALLGFIGIKKYACIILFSACIDLLLDVLHLSEEKELFCSGATHFPN